VNEFQVKDSGQRAQFGSGMVRDVTDGKPDYSLVFDGPMLERWAVHLTKGAQKYSKRNWMQADGDEELARFTESACRHFVQWMRGDTDEDHASALFFNVNGAEFVKGQQIESSFLEHAICLHQANGVIQANGAESLAKCPPHTPISETCTPDILQPVGPCGWTVKDEHKM
jgi:hypothetical protein